MFLHRFSSLSYIYIDNNVVLELINGEFYFVLFFLICKTHLNLKVLAGQSETLQTVTATNVLLCL